MDRIGFVDWSYMSTISLKKLDLADVRTASEARVFAGRTRGAKCRDHFGLEKLDADLNVHIQIEVPKDTLAITTSFLLSFLGPSMQKAGSKEAFAQKFTFECPEYIRPYIQEGLERALKPSGSDAVSTALTS